MGVTAPKGFLASAVRAGIKKRGLDLALISSPLLCRAAAVFTQNSVKAAPVLVSQSHLKDGYGQAIIINSGCANACTGREGEIYAKRMCRKTAELLGISERDVFVASTGIIGEKLPLARIEGALPGLTSSLSKDGGEKASMAILTTDTRPKTSKIAVNIGARKVTLGGMAKGSGMISPRMATLLSFVTTDCDIIFPLLRSALKEKVSGSFNQLSIDADMSTNDSLFILANGAAGNPLISRKGKDYFIFEEALGELIEDLTVQIAKDGEGATRLVEIFVKNALTLREAREAGRDIVRSILVKSMVFGKDPNFGRIVAAIGRRGTINEKKIKIWLQGVNVFRFGKKTDFNHRSLSKKMDREKVSFLIDLGRGSSSAKAWGCDLTPEYVRINAEYST